MQLKYVNIAILKIINLYIYIYVYFIYSHNEDPFRFLTKNWINEIKLFVSKFPCEIYPDF